MPLFVRILVLFAIIIAPATAARTATAQATVTQEDPGAAQLKPRPQAGKSASVGSDEKPSPSRDSKNQDVGPRNIYMVVQADSAMNQVEVGAKFESARKSLEGCSFQGFKVDPIEPNTYFLLKSILQNGVVPPKAATKEGVTIEPLEGQEGAWTLSLTSDTKYLESVEVAIKRSVGGEQEKIIFTSQPKDKIGVGLRYYSPGVYILRLPAGSSPQSITFLVSAEEDGSASPTSISLPWPDAGRCYLVTLLGVEGDEKELFTTLQDGKKIANPLKELQDATKAALIVATFREAKAQPIKFLADAIEIKLEKPAGGVEPALVWMRFPLTAQELKDVSGELDKKFAANDGFKTVPAWLRQNQLGEKLTPEGSVGWIDIPWNEERKAFMRTLPIDTKAWQERLVNNREFMGDNAVLIYEFEDKNGAADSREIIKNENDSRYKPETIAGWLTGLPDAPRAKATTDR